MTKMRVLNTIGWLMVVGGGLTGCGEETLTEPDAQSMGEARQALANGKRFNTLGEPSGVAARADLQVYRHSDNTSYARRTYDGVATGYPISSRSASTEDVPVQGDFDGDSLYDVATYRPSTAEYAVRRSSNGLSYTFGFGTASAGAFPAVGDFDGDGASDHGIWRSSNGIFYALKSSDSQYLSVALGQNGDIPVIGNYDGDSKDDFAVWRPSNGTWYFVRSSTGTVGQFTYGVSGDVPVVGDFDGDGKTDFAVFRPSNGRWYIRNSSTGTASSTAFGGAVSDYPVPADYDGDGKTDLAFWRPATGAHHMRYSGNGAIGSTVYGGSGDIPANAGAYCKNAQGLMRPCNSDNAAPVGNPVVIDSSLFCLPPSATSTYPLPAPGVSETNYYAKVRFATSHATSGILGVYDSSFSSHDRDIYLTGGNICTYTWVNGATETLCTSGINYADGRIHEVVHSLNSTGNELYVDGVLRRMGTFTASAFNWETQFVVGYAGGVYATPAGASNISCVYHVEAR